MNVVVTYYNRPSDLLLSKVSPLELWTYFLSHILKYDRWVIKKTAGSRWYKLTGMNHVKVKFVPMLRHENMSKSEVIATFILEFGTVWVWMSSVISRPSLHLGQILCHALNRGLVGSQMRPEYFVGEGISCPCRESNCDTSVMNAADKILYRICCPGFWL
jgi:hypothetical protein